MLGLLNTLYFSHILLEFISGPVADISDFTAEIRRKSMYLYGHPFLFDQTPKNYLIMVGLFSIRISDFFHRVVAEMLCCGFCIFW